VKGKVWILAVLVSLLSLTSASFAQDQFQNALPLEQVIKPGHSTVTYNGITYHFVSKESFEVRFEKVDDTHVRIYVKPLDVGVQMFCTVSVQWSSFPPITLEIDPNGGNSFLLGTETGYAEK